MTLVATLPEFKAWLRITGDAQDDKLMDVLNSATEWVVWRIGGPLSSTSYVERLRTRGTVFSPTKRPLVAVVSITPEGASTAFPASSWTADTTNSLIRMRRFIPPGWYIVAYSAGLTVTHYRCKNAGLELARHLWLTQNGSVGRGRNDDDVPTPMGFAVPRRVDELLTSMPDALPGFA